MPDALPYELTALAPHPVRDAALSYAARGWPVFPCRPDKRPYTPNGFKAASTDAARIEAWWREHPDALVACPTGQAVGAWVLDIDDPAEADRAMARLEISLPATARSDTHKGHHLWFAWDREAPVANAQRTIRGWPFPELPGAEVRGDGGYVILPPSAHPMGGAYSWARDEEPSEAPSDLLAIVRRTGRPDHMDGPPREAVPAVDARDTPYGLAALSAECEAIRSAGMGEQEGTLNASALKIGGLVAGGQLTRGTAMSQLLTAGLAMPAHDLKRPWTLAQVAGKIERGMEAGARSPRGPVEDDGVGAELAAAMGFAGMTGPDPLALDDVADWDGATIEPQRWLAEGWLPIGEAALLTGAGAIGKSLVAQQLATCIGAGRPFLGVPVASAPAIYITCEDARVELMRRQRDIAGVLGLRLGELRGRLLVRSWKGLPDNELATMDRDRRLVPTARFQALRSKALAVGARLVVLDNTAHLFGGDENVKREVAAFCNLLNGLAEELDGVVLLLGHPNKAGLVDEAARGNQFGGSIAWEAQVRSRLFMVGDQHDRDARELTNPKANYSAKGGSIAFRWHAGAFVRPADLPGPDAAAMSAAIRDAADNVAFLACLDERNRQERTVSENKASRTYAPKEFAAMVEARGASYARLEAAMDRLFRVGAIERGFVWHDGGEGKDRHGLRRIDPARRAASAEGSAAPADLPADHPLTSSADLRRPPADVPADAAGTHPSPKGEEGVAPKRAATPSERQGRAASVAAPQRRRKPKGEGR